jgi:precorrin-3B methylase
VVCLQEYIENIKQMFNKKLLAQKSTMDEMGSLYEASEAKLKAKIAECSSLSNQVYGSVAGVQSLTDEKLMLRKNLSEVKA